MSKILPDKLLLSSDFYSVQGEGKSTGVPSYFARMANCNLSCGFSREFANKILKENNLANGELFVGDLHEQGKASWTCDSTSQWLLRGENKDFQYLIDRWIEESIYEDIKKGTVHIIWTGGEPTIKAHQTSISNFFEYWKNIDPEVGKDVYSEIETNGTIYIEDKLWQHLSQINCSPKLRNSGMTEKQRIVPAAITRIMEHHNYQFKFVISTEEDIQELFQDFVIPFNIPLRNVVCMPGLDKQEDFYERTQFVLEMAKKYKFTGLTRLHIAAWDQVLDV